MTIAGLVHRIVLISCSLALSAVAAHAETSKEEAERLFEEGRALAKDGKFPEACERFTRSLELDHAVGTEINLADCREKLGELREAWKMFVAVAEEAEQAHDDKRTKFAHDRADTVAAKLVTVVVKVSEPTRPGLAITLAGRPVTPALEIRDHVDPGPIEVAAYVPNHPRFATTVTGAAGATVTVELPAFTDAPPITVLERSRTRVRITWGLAVVGGAAGLAATGITIKARSDYTSTADGPHCMHVSGGFTCDDTGKGLIRDAQRLGDIATVVAIGSGALLVTAAVVYFTSPSVPVVVTPTATTTSFGVAITQRF